MIERFVQKSCGKCGQVGHTRATCKRSYTDPGIKPLNRFGYPLRPTIKIIHHGFGMIEEIEEPAEPVPKPDADPRSVRERVQELYDGGLQLREVYDYLEDVPAAEVAAVYRHIDSTKHAADKSGGQQH